MNPKYLGDSYDLVKRFFIGEVRQLGYDIVVDPMFTGAWGDDRAKFHALIGADARDIRQAVGPRTALFLDPDTGVNRTSSQTHVAFEKIASEAMSYVLVFSFDQSFSREGSASGAIQRKLAELAELRLSGIYYDSHARFLFASREAVVIAQLRDKLLLTGIPRWRLVERHL